MIETIVTIRSPMVRMISVSLIGSFRSNSCAVASSVGCLYYLQEKVVLVQFSVEYGNVSPVDTYSPWEQFMDLDKSPDPSEILRFSEIRWPVGSRLSPLGVRECYVCLLGFLRKCFGSGERSTAHMGPIYKWITEVAFYGFGRFPASVLPS